MRSKVKEILRILGEKYPNPKPALNFSNPFELLIATILSAQTTDKQVNKITEKLFKKYPRPEDYARLSPEVLAQDLQGIGLHNNKSRHVIKTCQILLEKYRGEVPVDRQALEELPGVGRKTANVVLSNAFAIPAIAVDTHVFRVSKRLGLSDGKDVLKTEKDLEKKIPKKLWSDAHHWLIFHGREICQARKPLCDQCQLVAHCKQNI